MAFSQWEEEKETRAFFYCFPYFYGFGDCPVCMCVCVFVGENTEPRTITDDADLQAVQLILAEGGLVHGQRNDS